MSFEAALKAQTQLINKETGEIKEQDVFLGSIPTFVSAWKDPSREDKLAWTIYFASCIFTMFGIQNWTLEETAQPITFLVDETVMVYILYFHKKPVYLEISILEK